MPYQLTAKRCPVSPQTRLLVARETGKIMHLLPHVAPEFTLINIIIEPAEKLRGFKGHLCLLLPGERIHTEFHGTGQYSALKSGFRTLHVQISSYKGLHFTSSSRYPGHETIRHAHTEDAFFRHI